MSVSLSRMTALPSILSFPLSSRSVKIFNTHTYGVNSLPLYLQPLLHMAWQIRDVSQQMCVGEFDRMRIEREREYGWESGHA